jgi:hypothetical protein
MSLRPSGEEGRLSTASGFISAFYSDDSDSHTSGKDEDYALSTARSRARNSSSSPRSSATGSVLAADHGLKQRRLSNGQIGNALDVRVDPSFPPSDSTARHRLSTSGDLGRRWPMSPEFPQSEQPPPSQERYESWGLAAAGPAPSHPSLMSPSHSVSPAASDDALVFSQRRDPRPVTVGEAHPLTLKYTNSSSEDVDESDDAPLRTNMAFVPNQPHSGSSESSYSFPPRSSSRRRPSPTPSHRSMLQSAKHSIRRMSIRVASLAAGPPEGAHFRLPEAEEDGTNIPTLNKEEAPAAGDTSATAHAVLRGKSLGLFGPHNAFRLACRRVLLWQ